MDYKVYALVACITSLLNPVNAEFMENGGFELDGHTGSNALAAFTGWTGAESAGQLRFDAPTTSDSVIPGAPNTALRLLGGKFAEQTISASWAGADTFTLSLNACEVSWKNGVTGNGVWVTVEDPVNQTEYYSVLVDLDGTHNGESYPTWAANQTFSFAISGADLIGEGAVAGQDLNVTVTSLAGSDSINWVDNVSLTLANLPTPDIWFDGGQGLQLVDERIAVWTNLASPGTYDAVQSDVSKRPTLMYESFPGHQVIGFDGVDDILTLENTAGNALFEGELTVFYVGRTLSGGSFSGTGGFLGNFQTGSNFKNGWNLRTQSNGSYNFLLGNGAWNDVSGGTASLGGDFVLLNGRYSDVGDGTGTMELFSSLLEDPATAQTSPFTMNSSSVDISIGMFCGWQSLAFNQAVKCEVAEIRIYGQALSDLEREAVWGELSAKYAVAEEQAVTVDSFSPSGDSEPVDTSIEVTFNIAMDPTSIDNIIVGVGGLDGLPENGSWSQATGQWVASADNKTFAFTATPAFQPGALVMCEIPSSVVSAGGSAYTTSSRETYSFIIDNGESYSVTKHTIDPMATVYHDNSDAHILPMTLEVPATAEPCPVMFWVHGGGWNGGGGGSWAKSATGSGMMSSYFTSKLGVAVVGVAWRGQSTSQGTFTKMQEDISLAVQYVIDHADEYNLDVSRMGLYGGSAGTPASALLSQENSNISCYIGFNGLYDFANRGGGSFGGGTSFGQNDPSYTENSAALNVRVTNPPDTLLLHGSADTLIEHEQSEWYEAAIEAVGGTASTLIYRDEVHAFFNPGRDMFLPTMYACVKHLTRVFNLSETVTPYDQWAAATFSAAPEGADITASGNPDGDRFDNELEWALVTDPLVSDTPTLDLSEDNGNFVVTYFRRDSAVTGIDVYASWTTFLSAEIWKLDGDGMTESSMGWNDDIEEVSVSLPLDGTFGFIRINAEPQ